MVSSTILASGIIFLICFLAPVSLFSVCPEALSVSVALAGYFGGMRGVAVMLPVCWTVLSAAWVLEGRLAADLHGHDFELNGVICDVPNVDTGVQRFPFVIDGDQRVPGLPAQALINWYDSEIPVRAGERWHLTIRLKRPRGTRNPAGFDFERWAFMRDIGATGYVRHSVANRRLSPAGEGCQLAAFRQRLASGLEAAIPDAVVPGHILALTVGIRNRLDNHDWTVLRRTGTAHLMAISGLHIGLAAAFAFFCFRQLGRWLLMANIDCRPLVIARGGALVGAAAYSALAGFTVPTVRALVMTTAVIVLTGLRRSIPASAVLAIALYAILWTGPFAMLASGFWLSFGAVFILVLSGIGRTCRRVPEPRSRAAKALRQFRQLLRAQWCLSIGLLPATAFFFGQVSLIAPVANLLVVPVFAVSIVPLLIVGVIALLVVPPFAGPILQMADFILAHIIAFLDALNRWDSIVIAPDLPGVSGWISAIGVLIAVVLIWPRPLPGRMQAIMLLSACAALGTTRNTEPALRVVVMDVGQGLAVLLQMPDHAVLFDTGPRYRRGDAGRSIVIPVLRYFGVTTLDRLIVSHGDDDHFGGARSVLAAYPEVEFLAPVRLEVPAKRFDLCRVGQSWQYDGVLFRFLHPGQADGPGTWSENDASCVLLVQSAHVGLLLPGDIEHQAEQLLVASGALPAVNLVIAPHHGSRTSSTRAFIAGTRPDFIVFSAGYRNQWRFPVPEVVNRWTSGGACALTTGNSGALVFEAHGVGPLRLVRRYRPDDARVWSESSSVGQMTPHCRSITSTN